MSMKKQTAKKKTSNIYSNNSLNSAEYRNFKTNFTKVIIMKILIFGKIHIEINPLNRHPLRHCLLHVKNCCSTHTLLEVRTHFIKRKIKKIGIFLLLHDRSTNHRPSAPFDSTTFFISCLVCLMFVQRK